jgi:hypothetical protein
MPTFSIVPFDGALPIKFGMQRETVYGLLGNPGVSGAKSDSWGPKLEINIGYTDNGTVNHVGLGPGEVELHLGDVEIWKPNVLVDPNPFFLKLDNAPLERLGFLVFTKLGVATTGFHDDDPGQYAVTVFPKGAWDLKLVKASIPDLSKYKSA